MIPFSPHPHLDPRQPQTGARPKVNPPVFAWKPDPGETRFKLTVATDPGMASPIIAQSDLSEPVYLPTETFAPGTYYWMWEGANGPSSVFEVEITPDAVALPVSSALTWIERFPSDHPRLYIRPEGIDDLRQSRFHERAGKWAQLSLEAEHLLGEPHEIDEPPFLANRQTDYAAYHEVLYRVMMNSRRFIAGARTLALAYQASGERKYGEAAAMRLASISAWDPMGSSHIDHNDEAHMSVIWNGPVAADWAWDCFTEAQKARVIDQFRRRGEITFEHMHDKGSYGVTRFDSHAGREVIFLALTAIVFHDHIPDAAKWLEWLRPILCGIWPIWANDDGAWAEGPCYGLWYIGVMTTFASALKTGAGVDLYRKPFWRNHARWRKNCQPYYAEWVGFGDHSEPWEATWRSTAALVELIGRETRTGEFDSYVAGLRKYASRYATPMERRTSEIDPIDYLCEPLQLPIDGGSDDAVLRIYPECGWAALRTSPEQPKRDVAFLFRSSPYGSSSHSHANQNDFILHVAGHCVAMPSGYYDAYASPHHSDWVWHTKSHNCVTLSDSSQIMRSYEARGRIEHAYEDDKLAYMVGIGDLAYANSAAYCRRHVIFLKQTEAIVLIDEFRTKDGIVSNLQWNMHSWDVFEIDDAQRGFRVGDGGGFIQGRFLTHLNSYFSVTQNWTPPPLKTDPMCRDQYHLQFTLAGPAERRILGTVLLPEYEGHEPALVRTFRSGKSEAAWIGGDLILISQGGEMSYEGYSSNKTTALRVSGTWYEIDDDGISTAE